MEREILFKGKRVDNGEWIYGNYVKTSGGNNHSSLKRDRHDIYPISIDSTNQEVFSETVCQFINRFDKKGNRIFYDDKMKGLFADRGTSKAKFKELEFTINFDPEIGFFIDCENYGEFRFYPHMEDCEVIGNIHD